MNKDWFGNLLLAELVFVLFSLLVSPLFPALPKIAAGVFMATGFVFLIAVMGFSVFGD